MPTTLMFYFVPHGVAIPEMLEDESIREVMDELKQKESSVLLQYLCITMWLVI